jgi:hypothetical protein
MNAAEYVPLFQASDDAEFWRDETEQRGARYLQCRRCGQHIHITQGGRGLFAGHVSSWHRQDVASGMIVRVGSQPFKIRSDAPRKSHRREKS